MFDKEKVKTHQAEIRAQSKRKDRIGKMKYNTRKLFEEVRELGVECHTSNERMGLSKNFINELGDVLTCVLGDSGLTEQLQERLDFNDRRIKVYKDVDRLRELDPVFERLFKGLKYTPDGWFRKLDNEE